MQGYDGSIIQAGGSDRSLDPGVLDGLDKIRVRVNPMRLSHDSDRLDKRQHRRRMAGCKPRNEQWMPSIRR